MAMAAVIINRSRIRDLRGFRLRCERAAAGAGWEMSFLETSATDPGAGLAAGAVRAGAGLIFAAGGDGTVRACAHGAAGTGVPLAILPLGTANLAARALGLPARIGAALDTGLRGRDRRIDLADANGMTFVAMAGMGVDAAVVGATPTLLKAGFGWLAYAGAGVVHLPGRATRFTLRLDDGEPTVVWARSVVAANAGLLPGGFLLIPQARMDDGVLDVGILAPSGLPGWVRVGHRVLTGSRHDDRHLTRLRARRVEITAADELPRQVDGEVIAPGRSLSITLAPHALTVRVPARGRPGRVTR